MQDIKRHTLNVSRLALAGGDSWTVEAPPAPGKDPGSKPGNGAGGV